MNRLLTAALFAIGLFTARSAHAEGRFVSISSEGCALLHDAEIERVLGIELASVAESWTAREPLRVELTCEGARVRAVAVDPVTDKRLSRDVDLESVTRDRDRTLALVVSQLFLTSWSELLIEARRETPPVVVPKAPPPPAVTHAAESLARDATGGSDARLAVAATAGPRLRALDAPHLAAHVALRPSLALGPHGRVLLELGYERGSTARALGSVGWSLASALAGASWQTHATGPLSFQMGALAGIAYADVTGDATAPALGGAARSVLGEGALFAGPVLSSGVVHVGLDATLGLTFPRAVAHVERGDDVVLSGLWAGASLVLAIGDEAR